MHSPACTDALEHVRKCVASLEDTEGFNLRDFLTFVQFTFETEHLVSDPDIEWVFDSRRLEVAT